MRIGHLRTLLLVLLATYTVASCGQKFEQSFQVAYLSYGEAGVPYGSLVVADYAPDSGWTTAFKVELARQATLLYPPPYHVKDGVPFLSISANYKDKNSALWIAKGDESGGSHFEVTMSERCALLWSNNRSASAAAVLFAGQEAAQIRPTPHGRDVVSLTSNACSVAVVRYAEPDRFDVLASANYARPAWFDDERLGYISRSDYLIARGPDSTVADTLAAGVESFSVAQNTGVYAVCFKGDSIVVFDADHAPRGPAIEGASVPVISPDGRWLAYHASDHGIWARELATGVAHELGVGYPVNWAPESGLLMFFERRVNDRNESETIFHVCEPETGSVVTLPTEGDVADAILLK